MLARAIVGRPRLLLIDGTLDALPDETLPALLANLVAQGRPWTALIATGRQVVMDCCDRVVTLGRQSQPVHNGASGADFPIKKDLPIGAIEHDD
jgi:ABC-type bacteriocin/lantibiotic exporter with double-glycine peptidase domain